jgi:hypothetical protein
VNPAVRSTRCPPIAPTETGKSAVRSTRRTLAPINAPPHLTLAARLTVTILCCPANEGGAITSCMRRIILAPRPAANIPKHATPASVPDRGGGGGKNTRTAPLHTQKRVVVPIKRKALRSASYATSTPPTAGRARTKTACELVSMLTKKSDSAWGG